MTELDAGSLPVGSNLQPAADSAHDSNRSAKYPSARVSLAIGLASLVALGITAYLVSVAMTSSKIAGCGGGQIFDCNDVVNSRWSRLLGVPVSILALGLYLSVLSAIIVGSRSQLVAWKRDLAWKVVIFGGLSAGLAAIWFTSLQFFVVKHLCSYCLAAHTCGLIISVILIWSLPLGAKAMRPIALLSVVGVGMLIGGQLAFKPVTHQIIEYEVPINEETTGEIFEFVPPADNDTPDVSEQTLLHRLPFQAANLNPSAFIMGLTAWQQQPATDTNFSPSREKTVSQKTATRRLVPVQGGSFQLDVAQWPLLGKPDAKYIFIEMLDYTCDHCRRTHQSIAGAKQKLGDDLAVIVLPIPLNTKCNSAITTTGPRMAEACEIAQLAIAVWRVAPEKFALFHEYLMTTSTSPPTFVESKAKAIELLGTEKVGDQPSLAEKLESEFASQTPAQYIDQHVKLYQRVGSGTVPKLMFPGKTIVGEFTSGDALVNVIEQQLK